MKPKSSLLTLEFLEHAPCAFHALDASGLVLQVNATWLGWLGYAREEVEGKLRFDELLSPTSQARFARAVQDLKARGSVENFELTLRRKDGTELPVLLSATAVYDDSGAFLHSRSIFVNITAGARFEQSYYRMLDAAPDALVVVDTHGKIRFVNAQTEAVFGYTREELLDKPVEVLIPERVRTAHEHHRSSYAVRPTVRPMSARRELLGRRKDGTEFPVEVSLSPLQTESGVLITSAVRDVTERKRTEAQAALANQRLLSAVESIQGMFALFDAERRLVMCNSDFRHFFAYAIEGPIVGRSFEDILDGNLRAEHFDVSEEGESAFRARWLAQHSTAKGTLDLRTRDGHTLRAAHRPTPEGGVVMTIWDITEDMNREQELRKARALAEAASSAKSEFLSSMSHELRTPLNAVLGFAQLLYRDKKNPLTERQKEKLDHILKGGEHLLHLIDDVLDLARIEAGRVAISVEPVSVLDVLENVQATLEPMAARADTKLEISPAPAADLRVSADRTRFAQILMNYASNAIKYGKAGSVVRFVATLPDEETVRVAVIDQGAGIPLDKQDKIFQPFQRAGQELGPIEGTGIGLAICKRLAEIMGGSVGFRSEPQAGSEFWVDLPRWKDAAVRDGRATDTVRAAVASPLAEGEGAPHTIVYIEDNPSNIAFMQDLIADFERVRLITAPSAEIGIELTRAQRPDVVIMDINLPGMNGFEAARKLREWPETRDIPVVALSAAAMMRDTQRSEAAVFYRYLTKPVNVDALIGTLEELLVTSTERAPS
jgi:PAS domain S-box-containing protein